VDLKEGLRVPTGFKWLKRERPVTGFCEHIDEPSGSINTEEYLDTLCGYLLLKKDFAVWSCIIR
jgi:hypothetical protein